MCDRSRLANEARIKELRSLVESMFDQLDENRAGNPKNMQDGEPEISATSPSL